MLEYIWSLTQLCPITLVLALQDRFAAVEVGTIVFSPPEKRCVPPDCDHAGVDDSTAFEEAVMARLFPDLI